MRKFSKLQNRTILSILVIFTIMGSSSFVIFPRGASAASATVTLSVDADQAVQAFSDLMLGQALVNWEHSWGKLFPNDVPGLAQAMKAAHIGMIRYAGGLWANYVGWDRVPQITPYTQWTKNGQTYSFHYGTDEIDNLAAFAKNAGVEVMIQVNIANFDPGMWADMLRYTNIDHDYDFKYWELGNEFDHDTQVGLDPEIYAQRATAYIDALKAVDPSVVIIGGVPASAHDAPRQGWSDSVTDMSHYLSETMGIESPDGYRIDSLSYHWYQSCNNAGIDDLINYQFPGLDTDSWRNAYSRIWSGIAPARVQNEILTDHPQVTQGITELNFDACAYDHVLNGNHMNALWVSDIIGRLAYNGLDFITWYEGYGIQGYASIYPDQNDTWTPPNKVMLRPSYYPFFMYGNYFGDMLVESSSSDEGQISIWASTDSDSPGDLRLMVTNLANEATTTEISLQNFLASRAEIYILQSNNPTSTTPDSNTEDASTAINGIKLDGMNVTASAAQIQPQVIPVVGSSFNFTFPAYSATAIVLKSAGTTPTPTPGPSQTFEDVSPAHPYYSAIEALYAAGYTAGCGTEPLIYCPDQAMNRVESAVFIERGIHGTDLLPGDPPLQRFDDLTLDSWGAKWAEALWQDQFTAGCGTEPLIYCPWQGHSRVEGAVFYLRMLNGVDYLPLPSENLFADMEPDFWGTKWAEAAYLAGLLPACAENPMEFCPEGPLDRGLAAYMMVQAKGISAP
jgi:hypothetical protein